MIIVLAVELYTQLFSAVSWGIRRKRGIRVQTCSTAAWEPNGSQGFPLS